MAPDTENTQSAQHQPALIHQPTSGATAPIVFDNPHSAPHDSWLWDAFIDRLLADIPGTGIPVLETQIPRTTIDMNRAIAEIDPSIFNGAYWPFPHRLTANVRRGMGLIPFLLKRQDGTLVQAFNAHSQLSVTEVKRRIDQYYIPYYNTLTALVKNAHQAHNFAVHFNFHSAPRPDAPANKDIILGDLYGKSSAPAIVEFVREFMKRENLSLGMNKPYPGGELIRTTGLPHLGYHSLQIEIARDLYMDQSSLTYDDTKGPQVRAMLTRLATALQDFVKDQADTLRAPPDHHP